MSVMCGIYGELNFNEPVQAESIRRLGENLGHRGPDSSDEWFDADRKVFLGHKRLKIVDLSAASSQPMMSPDGRYILTFNGEIYNYKDLRNQLRSLGHSFRSSGDTEVLLAAFIEWGEKCLLKLDGMFSFLVYDRGSSSVGASIFFARDRAGEKPFFYSNDESKFSFASELKGVLRDNKLSLKALNYYLSLGYVPDDLCLFEGVNKLPPGHYGKMSLLEKRVEIERYWDLPKNDPMPGVTPSELVEKLGTLLESSVKSRLEADVPVGVMLSGGLDSSLIVAAASRVSGSKVQTYTMALPGSSLDESNYAKMVANHFGTEHHELAVNEASLELLDEFSIYVDEPIADSSVLPSYMVFGEARKNVTVVLGGDGGDELFGGYKDYTDSIRDARRLRFVPPTALKMLAESAALLPTGVRGRNKLYSLREGAFRQMIWGTPYFDSVARQRLLSRGVTDEIRAHLNQPEDYLAYFFDSGRDPVESMMKTHFKTIMPDDFLVKVDRTSMAHSLEVRTPFLDPALIDFAYKEVPSGLKVADGESRIIQKLLGEKWLPKALELNRKQGFSLPLDVMLRHQGEDNLMSRLEWLPDYFSREYMHSLVKGLLKGRSNGARVFALIMLSIAIKNATVAHSKT